MIRFVGYIDKAPQDIEERFWRAIIWTLRPDRYECAVEEAS